MEWPDSTVITPAILPDWWTATRSGFQKIRKCRNKSLTVGRGGQLQVLVVVCHQPLDQVDLFQGDLHCVLVLGPTGGVGHPQLGVEYLLC